MGSQSTKPEESPIKTPAFATGATTLAASRERIAIDRPKSVLDSLKPAVDPKKDEEILLKARQAALDTTTTSGDDGHKPSSLPAKKSSKDLEMEKYSRFRDEMLNFMLGESAYDYAERLYAEHPDDPSIMAFVGETSWKYEARKISAKRSHWIDRMDLLQRGIDVSRRCIKEHPEFGPCYRSYVLCATKAADQVYHWRWMKGIGDIEHYHGIMKYANKAVELTNSFDVISAVAMLNARCAQHWYSPYRVFGLYYGIPKRQTMLERAVTYHRMAHELDPYNLENVCRLAMCLFEVGEINESRRWYVKVRDEMAPEKPTDEKWQSVAHTHLCMRFHKQKWNVRSG